MKALNDIKEITGVDLKVSKKGNKKRLFKIKSSCRRYFIHMHTTIKT